MGDMVRAEAKSWRATVEYDKLGFETKRSLPGGIVRQWKLNGIGLPIEQIIGHKLGDTFSFKKRKQYFWEAGTRLKRTNDEKGSTFFVHDAWSNLAKTTFPNGEEQLRNPDAIGNLFESLDRTDRTYTNAGQLKKAKGWQFSYDPVGNLIEKKHVGGDLWNYEWNDEGMLVKVIRPDKAELILKYDALGRRLSKQFKNTITKFIWDVNVPLHEWKS
jgi:YD repeat-containing protein